MAGSLPVLGALWIGAAGYGYVIRVVLLRNRPVGLTAQLGLGMAGLGLDISRGIIELHNGRIWVEPNMPKGSIFRVYLPWDPDS